MGMSLADVDDMPISEYLKWQKYDKHEPLINGYMLDVLFARLMYVVAAAAGCKNINYEQFLTFTEAPPKSNEEILSVLKRMGFKETEQDGV